jgi:cytidylate kinase
MIIAVDGPAASGKGTLARRLAQHFELPHLDTGSLYRATGVAVLRTGGDPASEADAAAAARALEPAILEDPELRSDRAAEAASQVAAIPAVRDALLQFQRDFARQTGGAVLDGRDVGTVVCPDADAKLFVTASVEVRAERRLKELRQRGHQAIYPEVLRDMKQRDERDSRRAVAPLVPAVDAYVMDTSAMDPDQAFAEALAFIMDKSAGPESA